MPVEYKDSNALMVTCKRLMDLTFQNLHLIKLFQWAFLLFYSRLTLMQVQVKLKNVSPPDNVLKIAAHWHDKLSRIANAKRGLLSTSKPLELKYNVFESG